ncbi:MAG: DNA methyltransferase [Bellilinea sp.]|jgi:DNA modification methylase
MDFLNSQIDLTEFIRQYGKPYDPATDDYRRPPFASPVKAGKATAIYNAHSYHTKVPPQGIEPYIAHYTNPGDIVLDPFCGSGMTGVAALMQGRRVILNDLSPAAAHIAYNYCTPVDVVALKQEFERIKAAVADEFEWLYGTICDRCGGQATIYYILWCDVLECDRCGQALNLWDLAMDKQKGEVRDDYICPNCLKQHVGRKLRWLKIEPVYTNYECERCNPKRGEHPTTSLEKEKITGVESSPITNWYPKEPFDESFEMWRAAHRDQGITDSSKFYTSRNLRALALLWHQTSSVQDISIRSKLQFAFTSMSVKLASRMSNVSFRGPNKINLAGQLPGTLYIPALSAERNVWLLFTEKYRDVVDYAMSVSRSLVSEDLSVSVVSATKLNEIPESSIDYIFTDPPFGSNLFYADLNFLWEAWLKSPTDQTYEAVAHLKVKEKNTIHSYARLMTQSFVEMYRVLKPNRWASVVFHNSDDKIWQIILDSAQSAGLELVEINSFDKEQLTFKGHKGAKGLERVTNKDIVLNLRKPGLISPLQTNGLSTTRNGEAEARIAQRIADFLTANPSPEKRTLQHFWNVVLYDMLVEGVVDVSMEKVGAILPHYFKQVDGRWYLRGETVAGGNVFDLKSDTGAIAWLNAVLSSQPQTIGDLIPKWQSTTATLQGVEVEPGRMERLLEQNFWLDKRTNRWRIPTPTEREQMSAAQDISAQAHLRTIHRYLRGEGEHKPDSRELAAWIQFTYNRGAHAETIQLYDHLDESQLEPEYSQSIRKMVQVSRLKAKT